MCNLPFKTNINFINIKRLIPKEIGIRKKLDIYTGTDSSKNFYLILHIVQKSRFLQKDVEKIEEIYTAVCNYINNNFDKKLIYIDAPLCSKAKTKLENLSWECRHIILTKTEQEE